MQMPHKHRATDDMTYEAGKELLGMCQGTLQAAPQLLLFNTSSYFIIVHRACAVMQKSPCCARVCVCVCVCVWYVCV